MHKTTGARAIIFFSIVFFIVALANVAFYLAFKSAFGLTGTSALWARILVLLLSGGFIGLLIAEKYTAALVVQRAYLVTSVWLGMFAYLFIATVLYGISVLFVAHAEVLGQILFGIAFLVGVYGVVHGQKRFVKKIAVSLPGLPASWQGRTAVWMSDLHLGSIQGKRFAAKVARMSNELSPDVVFIGGDLYDGTHAPDPTTLAEPLRELRSTFGTFYITGNHEEFGDPSSFLHVVKELGMQVLHNESVDVEGLQIVGVDYASCVQKENFKKVLEDVRIDLTRASLLLKHEPRDLDVSLAAGISLQISGHTHKGQQWPFSYLANSVYKGYGYGLRPLGAMLVYVSSGIGTWGPPLRVGSRCEIVHITFT